MTKYEKNARAEADAYEAERKAQAQTTIASINAAAEEERQAALSDTAASIDEEERTLLDTVDIAAVERQVTRRQAREALSHLGLGGSGYEAAALTAARRTEAHKTGTARRSRDAAVQALTDALARREAEIEQQRTAAEQKEIAQSNKDVQTQRTSLINAAVKAESAEKRAALRVEEAKVNAEAAAERQAASKKETARKQALRELYKKNLIHQYIYTRALDRGWDTDETLRQQVAWTDWRRRSAPLVEAYLHHGYDNMIFQLAKVENVTDDQLSDLCFELKLDIDRVRADLATERGE